MNDKLEVILASIGLKHKSVYCNAHRLLKAGFTKHADSYVLEPYVAHRYGKTHVYHIVDETTGELCYIVKNKVQSNWR